jgi:DNA-binding MarR family transcriptional regulator
MKTGDTGSLPDGDEIVAFRRFNRLYTRFIGTLQESLLDTPHSLSEARVLYELATRRRPFAGEVARELGIDAGYLSRMLTKFQETGLVKRAASLEDGRQTHLTLTKEGRAAFRNLNARSDRQARSILGGLAPVSRTDLDPVDAHHRGSAPYRSKRPIARRTLHASSTPPRGYGLGGAS